jgi:hypothetical protein
MAGERGEGLLRLPRRADQPSRPLGIPSPCRRTLAARPAPAQPEGQDVMDRHGSAGRSLAPSFVCSVAQAPDIPSLAVSALSRQIPKVRAVCGNSARAVLCGGRPVMGVPTAIKSLVRRAAPSLARPPTRHRRDTGAADAGNVGSNGACISPRLRPSGWPRSCGGPLRGVRRIWPGDGGDWDGSRFPPRPGASVNRPSHERRCRR